MAVVIEEKITRGLREVGLLGFTALALFLMIALLTFNYEDAGWSHSGTGDVINNACGVFGAWVSDFLLSIFGLMAYLFPVMIFWHGYLLFFQQRTSVENWIIGLRWFGFVITLISGSSLLYLHLLRTRIALPVGTGGYAGQEMGEGLLIILGNSGATLTLLVTLLAGITLFSSVSWLVVIDMVGKYTIKLGRFIFDQSELFFLDRHNNKQRKTRLSQYPVSKPVIPATPVSRSKVKIEPALVQIEKSERENKERQVDIFPASAGALPSLMLLDELINHTRGFSQVVLHDMSRMVEDILQDFNVDVEVVAVNPGPVVTRFELQLATLRRVGVAAEPAARLLMTR